MPEYENETCEGCVHFDASDAGEGPYCWYHRKTHAVPFPVAAGFRCDDPDDLTPSLECRKVRALEKLAGFAGIALTEFVGGQEKP